MGKVLTIGETMVVFSPDTRDSLRYVNNFSRRTGGAESNVAVGLAKLGMESTWFSRVGNDEFGILICNSLRAEGVDCSHVIFDQEHRTGVFFKELGVQETKVFYYRENSAASHLCPDDLCDSLFDGVSVLHISGITPVLSESCREMTLKAIEMAKQRSILVSFDPNIRKKLWKDQDFAPLIRNLLFDCDLALLGLDEAEQILKTRIIEEICNLLFQQGRATRIAIKDGANGAYVADKNRILKIEPYPCKPIDPVGAGDGFNAGFLAGILQNKDLKTAGTMGSICGALATQSLGDVEGYPDAERLQQALNGTEIVFR